MIPAPHIAVLLMAAGQSRRMGRDKLLLQIPNRVTLLEDRITTCKATDHSVYVALNQNAENRQEIVTKTGAIGLLCPDAQLGMGHTLANAMSQLPSDLGAVLITLADMPAISAKDMWAVCDAFDPQTVIRGATSDGAPGHPVLIPAKFFQALTKLTGDVGAQKVLRGLPTRFVTLPENHATFDLDTPEDWAAWITDNTVR